MESASAERGTGSKSRRGWAGLGRMLSTGISRITGSSGFSACFLPLSQNPLRSSQLVLMSAFPFPAGFCFLFQHTSPFARNLPFFSLWPPAESHSLAIRKKATAKPSLLIGAAKRHTKTILSSLFPIRCVKQPLSGTQENQGDLTISRLIKRRGGVCGGNLWFPTTFERSGSPAAAAGVSRVVAAGHSEEFRCAAQRHGFWKGGKARYTAPPTQKHPGFFGVFVLIMPHSRVCKRKGSPLPLCANCVQAQPG